MSSTPPPNIPLDFGFLLSISPRFYWPQTEYVNFVEEVEVVGTDSDQSKLKIDRKTRALLEMSTEARDDLVYYLQNGPATEAVKQMETYLEYLFVMYETAKKYRRKPGRVKGLDFESIDISWTSVCSSAPYNCKGINGEFFSSLVSYAVLLSCDANARLLSLKQEQHDAQERLDNIIGLYRRGAGILQYVEDNFNLLQSTMRVKTDTREGDSGVVYLFRHEALANLKQVFLLQSQVLSTALLRLSSKLHDVKMCAIMVENAMLSLDKLRRDRYAVSASFANCVPRLLLGLFYLYRAIASEAEGRARQHCAFYRLGRYVFDSVSDSENVRAQLYSVIQQAKPEENMYLSDRDLTSRRHQLDTLLVLKVPVTIINYPESLLVDPLDFETNQQSGKIALLIHSRFQRDRNIKLIRKKSTFVPRTQLTSLVTFKTNEERLTAVTNVDSWKYGIERINDNHHRVLSKLQKSDQPETTTQEAIIAASQGTETADERTTEIDIEDPKPLSRFTFVKGSKNHRVTGVQDLIRSKKELAKKRRKISSPYFVRYDLNGKAERVYLSKQKAQMNIEINPPEERGNCALCQKEFAVGNLLGRVTKKRISDLQKGWDKTRYGLMNVGKSERMLPAFRYTTERVCLLCSHICSNVLPLDGSEEEVCTVLNQDNDDLALEKMIRLSIKDVVEQEFGKLPECEKQGIYQSQTQLPPIPPEFLNLAISCQAMQSSTHNDNSSFCALNAVDGNTADDKLLAKTKLEPIESWWSCNLGHVETIHTIRIWHASDVELKPNALWVLLARKPFEESMTLEQSLEHSDLSKRFSYTSRILEWCPRVETFGGEGEFRGRFIRVQAEKKFTRLAILQCEVFALPLVPLPEKRVTTDSCADVVRKSPVMIRAEKYGVKLPVAQALVGFRFEPPFADDPEMVKELADIPYENVCFLLKKRSKASKLPGGNDERLKIRSMINRCNEAYERVNVVASLKQSLERLLKSSLRSALVSSPEEMNHWIDQVKKREPEWRVEVDLEAVVQWQFKRLEMCFYDCLDKEMKQRVRTTSSDHVEKRVCIDSVRFAELFRFNMPGKDYIEDVIILEKAAQNNQLNAETKLLACVPTIEKNGVDWITFLLFLLFRGQLTDTRRRALRDVEGDDVDSAGSTIATEVKHTPTTTRRTMLPTGKSTSSSCLLPKVKLLRPASAAMIRIETKSLMDSVSQKVSCGNKQRQKMKRRQSAKARLKQARIERMQGWKEADEIVQSSCDEAEEMRDLLRELNGDSEEKDTAPKVDFWLKSSGLMKKREECSLCNKEFDVANLVGKVTKKGITKQLEEWGKKFSRCSETVTSHQKQNLSISSQYDQAKVCYFCNQFFLDKYLSPRNPVNDLDDANGEKKYEDMPYMFLRPHVQMPSKKRNAKLSASPDVRTFVAKHVKFCTRQAGGKKSIVKQQLQLIRRMSSRSDVFSVADAVDVLERTEKRRSETSRKLRKKTLQKKREFAKRLLTLESVEQEILVEQQREEVVLKRAMSHKTLIPSVRITQWITVRDFARKVSVQPELVARIVNQLVVDYNYGKIKANEDYGVVRTADAEEGIFLNKVNPKSQMKRRWKELSKMEKIAHIAAVKLQKFARRVIQWTRNSEARYERLMLKLKKEEEKKMETRRKKTLFEMDDFLDNVSRERRSTTIAVYKKACPRKYFEEFIM